MESESASQEFYCSYPRLEGGICVDKAAWYPHTSSRLLVTRSIKTEARTEARLKK